MIQKPDIGQYPAWMRPFIQMSEIGGRCCESIPFLSDDLYRVYMHIGHEPLYKIIFWLSIMIIKRDFKIYAIEQELCKLRSDRAIFTKREIDALKACAAEKMSEPTVEEEESWENALDDGFGGAP